MSPLGELIAWNRPLATAILAMVTVQLVKFVGYWLSTGRIDFQRLTGTGGMPSSHSASVAALAATVGLEAGWQSALFGATAFFSLIVIYDATGVRREAGRQARVLNRMIDDLKAHHHIEGERLKELLGHTGLEVMVGVAYGIVLAVALHP